MCPAFSGDGHPCSSRPLPLSCHNPSLSFAHSACSLSLHILVWVASMASCGDASCSCSQCPMVRVHALLNLLMAQKAHRDWHGMTIVCITAPASLKLGNPIMVSCRSTGSYPQVLGRSLQNSCCCREPGDSSGAYAGTSCLPRQPWP